MGDEGEGGGDVGMVGDGGESTSISLASTLGHSIIIILVGCGQRACSNYRWLALGEHNGVNPSCIIM